jgi:hypothetical protein
METTIRKKTEEEEEEAEKEEGDKTSVQFVHSVTTKSKSRLFPVLLSFSPSSEVVTTMHTCLSFSLILLEL